MNKRALIVAILSAVVFVAVLAARGEEAAPPAVPGGEAAAQPAAPGGPPPGTDLLMKATSTEDPAQRLAIVDEFLTKYPDHQFVADARTLKAYTLLQLNRFADAAGMLEGILAQAPSAELKSALAYAYARGSIKLDEAEKFAREALTEIGEFDPAKKPDPNMPDDYWKEYHSRSRASALDNLGLVLMVRGKLDEAEGLFRQASALYPDAEIDDHLASVLQKKGKAAEALAVLDALLDKEPVEDPEVMEHHRALYKEVKGSEGGYADNLKAHETARKVNWKKQLGERLVEKPAADFKVKTMEGKEIDLASLKGKTAIVTFWATWCQPCRMELPQFQKAFEKLAGDKVVFLAISTEAPAIAPRITKFLADAKYTFPVAISTEAAQAYGVQGIPHLVVIGPNGKLRYEQSGFDPSHDLADTLTIITELLK